MGHVERKENTMSRQPVFDALEDYLEMESRPWKVKTIQDFSRPEVTGKTSFLNKTRSAATAEPLKTESRPLTQKKKASRKERRENRRKARTTKIDLKKISLIRPEIVSVSSYDITAPVQPPAAETLLQPGLSEPPEENLTASGTEDLPVHNETESVRTAPVPEMPEQETDAADRMEAAGAEQTAPEAGSQPEQPAGSFESDSPIHEKNPECCSQAVQEEDLPETEENSPLVQASRGTRQPETAAVPTSQASASVADLSELLSSSQQEALFGGPLSSGSFQETESEPDFSRSRPAYDRSSLPSWARFGYGGQEKSWNYDDPDGAMTSPAGSRVWTFSTNVDSEQTTLSDNPFARALFDTAFEDLEEESSLEEWKDEPQDQTDQPEQSESDALAAEPQDSPAGPEEASAEPAAASEEDGAAEDGVVYPEVLDDQQALEQLREDEQKPEYQCSTYEIVSLIAYLIGVPRRIFENEFEPPLLEVYDRLDSQKHARIIRHLCICRTAIIRNYRQINDNMKLHHMALNNMPDLIPLASLRQLSEDGVNFIRKSSAWPSHHIVEINKLLSDRINNVKDLFPLWLNWQYVRSLFLMPNGNKDKGTKAASDLYYANKTSYPYQIYINWQPSGDGNILFNDKKFVSLLYLQNHDSFLEMNKVSDAGSYVKDSIYSYIEESEKLTVLVDCENSDPYRLCATFINLDPEYLAKISRIILFDDLHASSAWKILEQYTSIPVEYILTRRVKEDKSLVDMKLATRACKEHYQNQVDSFIIVSSDSDYWGLIETLDDARFLVMVEREKCGADIKRALSENGIFYCYIDSFYSGNAAEIQNAALFMELNRLLREQVHFNAKSLFKDALHTARLNFSPAEKQQFYNRHIRQMSLRIEEDGSVSVELKR